MTEYSIKTFANRFNLNEEYVRQCCREQAIGNKGTLAKLPAGFCAVKKAGRWTISLSGGSAENAAMSEIACVERLLEIWNGRLNTKFKNAIYATDDMKPVGMDAHALMVLGRAYIFAYQSNPVKCSFEFDARGRCSLEIASAKVSVFSTILELEARYPSKHMQELGRHFYSAWFNEIQTVRRRESRVELQHEPFAMQRNAKTEKEFRRLCINCGRFQGRAKSDRYCEPLCADRHRQWIKRLAKSGSNFPFFIQKQLFKVLDCYDSECRARKAPLEKMKNWHYDRESGSTGGDYEREEAYAE